MNYFKSISTGLMLSLVLPLTVSAGVWSTRVALTYLETVDGSSNGAVPVTIEDKLIPEFDLSYAFSPAWSAELVLTVPQEHEVKSGGTRLGEFKHLPPTLLGKYTFSTEGVFRPYVGAGVNFTLIFDDELVSNLKLDNYSVGPAGQVGFDLVFTDRWSLNLDLKKIMLRSDVKAGGVKVTEVRLDPWLYSLGLRYQF